MLSSVAFIITAVQLVVFRSDNNMSKRKFVGKKTSSKQQQLSLYKKSYKGGGSQDSLLDVFKAARQLTNANKVLYPGCHRHLTAALVFPEVIFVDCDAKVGPLYAPKEEAVVQYVEEHKLYTEESRYEFHCCNVTHTSKVASVLKDLKCDLLISLNAGAISEPCTRFVPKDGFLLVNDGHSDARAAFISGNWNLFGYWDEEASEFQTEQSKLDRCFQVKMTDKTQGGGATTTQPITKAQVEESMQVGTVKKRSFKLLFEPMFFLFQKR